MLQRIDFKSWWDEKYFHADGNYRPLYTLYSKLHKAKADLDHIEALCNCLRLGDLFGDLLLSERALNRTKRKKKSPTSTPPLEEMKLGEALAMASKAESLNKAIEEAFDKVAETVMEMRERFGSPIGVALDEFFLPHILHFCWSRGKKVDIWGSFFLLVVIEYMKGACDKPHYRLVDDLLRAVRKLLRAQLGLPPRTYNSGISPDGRCRAAVRIMKLKKEHPNWAAVVDRINRQLDINKNTNGKNFANHRENHSQDRPSALFRSIALEFSRRGLPIPAAVASKLP